MATESRVVHASAAEVWQVLADGWLYPLWVVGATRMRDVDPSWPAVGARLHHSVGVWPAVLDDDTEVLEVVPRQLLRLRARGWPAGAAEVEITLTTVPGGTAVDIAEDVVSGPARVVPGPLRRPGIRFRNRETLTRLALLAENREAGS
jgi:uncharacterized protein YndB with AHSA1/START domain